MLFDEVRTVAHSTGGFEPSGHRPRPGGHRHGRHDSVAQPARGQMASGKPSAAPGELHPAGHLKLITTERHRAHRYSAAERLLGDAHAAVGDTQTAPPG